LRADSCKLTKRARRNLAVAAEIAVVGAVAGVDIRTIEAAAGMAAGGTKIAERILLDFASTKLFRSAVE
jgi:hypothetical protein